MWTLDASIARNRLNFEAIEEFLDKQLESEQVLKQKERSEKWYARKIVSKPLSEEKPSPPQIEHWIDAIVAKKWNANAAARVYHIAKTGHDGNVAPFQKEVSPHALKVNSTNEIPGAFTPVRNAYGISQVLSWIAGTPRQYTRSTQMDAGYSILNGCLAEDRATSHTANWVQRFIC